MSSWNRGDCRAIELKQAELVAAQVHNLGQFDHAPRSVFGG